MKAEQSNRVENFKLAAKKQGKFLTQFPFDDTDVYKNIEAASYSLMLTPDAKLEAKIDTLIEIIGAAQEPDGYLYTARTIDPAHPHSWSGKNRWDAEEDGSHELYCSGHMFEAATAHFLATGKRSFLNIALKNADLLVKTFGWSKLEKAPGHEVVEMGLVKLYQVTKNKDYLNLAQFFVDIRGRNGKGDYAQNSKRLVDQTVAEGHAVRAGYFYAGAAEVAALTGHEHYVTALKSIWNDVVDKQMYLTGGTGATGGNEGFGGAYVLPNMSAYCETCASVSTIFWNLRMFQLTGEAKYYDVLERILYNALLSGVSISGDRFFYPNPLASNGQHERSEWFSCACCPPNIMRLIASLQGYVYATDRDALFVNLYGSNTGEIALKSTKLNLVQTSDYPWNGSVKLEVNPEKATTFKLLLRIPGWAQEKPMPGDLYTFTDVRNEVVKLSVNGVQTPVQLTNGYASLEREWKKGDVVVLDLPMSVRTVQANVHVKADSGRIAVERGPIVYCAEWPDNKNGKVLNLVLDKQVKLTPSYNPTLLGGVTLLKGQAQGTYKDAKGTIHSTGQPLTLIPYYAWANRGKGQMQVWFPLTSGLAQPVNTLNK